MTVREHTGGLAHFQRETRVNIDDSIDHSG